jgi:hypothetical protein
LQLLPREFWRLLPREFELLYAGYKRREDRAWEKVATLGLWVIAPWTKKQFTAAQLVGRSRFDTRPTPLLTAEDEEAAAELERARVLHEALKWAQEK